MSTPVPGNGSDPAASNVATAAVEVTERAAALVREEIELAKTEITEKLTKVAKGAAVGAVAGIFVVTALFYALDAVAWGVADVVDHIWLGFALVALGLLVLGAIAGFVAARWLKAGAPPTPDMAIQEAKLIKETIDEARSKETVS
jgi:hypothetical protein